MAPTGYEVLFAYDVVDMTDLQVLHSATIQFNNVHPPAHCHDDPVELEIQMECISRLKTLYHLRSELKNSDNAELREKLEGKKFIVKAKQLTFMRKE